MPISMTRAALVGLTMLAAPMAQAATLNGLALSVDYRFPDSDTLYPNTTPNPAGPFTVGAGVEAILDVEGVTWISLDFLDNALTILLDTSLGSPTWNNTAFNGLVIALGSPGKFTGFSLTSSTIGPVGTAFDDGTLRIDWAGVSYTDGSTLTFAIDYAAPVPLPAGLPLLALALGGLAVLTRRRAA